jgi:hypothetical protein
VIRSDADDVHWVNPSENRLISLSHAVALIQADI